MLTAALIDEAIEFLRGRVRRTPMEFSPALSKIAGVNVALKLESLQLTGSFKIRGAWFRMSRLTAAEKASGVLTCSAGNHGKGVAYAARELGMKVTICVPSSIDEAKYRGMIDLGAEVRVSRFPGYDETEDWALSEAAREGRPFLSAFDDHAVMAGNGGSLAAECLEEAPCTRNFIMPAGGGGLPAGFAFHAMANRPDSRIICCQHERSPGLQRSLDAGHAVTRLPAIETSAGGIEGGFGRLPFEVVKTRVARVAHVSEAEIEKAVRWMLAEHQYLIQPSAAPPLAAVLEGKGGELSAPAVVVITGRNVSLKAIERILHR